MEDAAGHVYALRRPPLSHVLPTAHDMAREHRVITALGPTAVPVPKTFGLCRDEAVNGEPFYVMEFVEGHIVRDATMAEEVLDVPARHRAGTSLAETLAASHAVDVDEVGLGDFAKRAGYIERQLRRWYEQFCNSQVEGLDTASIVGAVHDRLAADVPPQLGTAIVHGDYRLDNTVLGARRCRAGRARLGDLHARRPSRRRRALDGLLDRPRRRGCAPGRDAHDGARASPTAPRCARATPRRRGATSERLDFYVAFGYWKLACIVQGVYARYVGGAAAGDRSSVDGFGPASCGWRRWRSSAWRREHRPEAMSLYERHLDRPLDRPLLVVALEGWVDAGLGADGAITALLSASPTELVATFDGESLIDQRARRPVVHISQGINEGLTWPVIQLRVGTDLGGADVCYLVGPSPTSGGPPSWRRWSTPRRRPRGAHGRGPRGVPGPGTAHPARAPGRHRTRASADLVASVGVVQGEIDVPSGVWGALEVAFGDAGAAVSETSGC